MTMTSRLLLLLLALGACTPAPPATVVAPVAARDPRFDWLEYTGRDSAFMATPAAAGQYANPILQGFYPDPSVTRVGEDFYLVTSTFAYFPGIPVFRSRDLVSWTQIGNVIDRPSQLAFDSLGISRGVFAPTIQQKGGTFYVLNTCVDCGGNYVVTATDPAGPWSDPVWLEGIGGIDPSFFFDDDGRTYLLWNDAPEGTPLYEGHRAIWITEFDLAALRPIGPRKVLVNGGVDIRTKPIWIEGPHIFRYEGRYYLSAAEGGTAEGHSQVILRSHTIWGPYQPWGDNPILTQRTLPRDRPFPITSAGHAQLVRTRPGEWWATFLAVRPYADDYYNTGRETFLMPVTWKDGWPFITTDPVPYAHRRPLLSPQPPPGGTPVPTSGNFTVREEFDGPRLPLDWLMIRTPRDTFVDFTSSPGALTLRARRVVLGERRGQPSYVGRRQQHQFATVTTAMRYQPVMPGDRAGIAAFQDDTHWYLLAVGRAGGRRVVRLARRNGAAEETLAEAPIDGDASAPVYLRIEARGARYDFSYATRPDAWATLVRDADGTILSTKVAGGFVGVTIGPYAEAP